MYIHVYMYMYIYIYTHISYIYIYIVIMMTIKGPARSVDLLTLMDEWRREVIRSFGRGDGAVGNPHRAQISRFEFCSSSNFSIRAFRAQISQFELFELILLSKLDKQTLPPLSGQVRQRHDPQREPRRGRGL